MYVCVQVYAQVNAYLNYANSMRCIQVNICTKKSYKEKGKNPRTQIPARRPSARRGENTRHISRLS